MRRLVALRARCRSDDAAAAERARQYGRRAAVDSATAALVRTAQVQYGGWSEVGWMSDNQMSYLGKQMVRFHFRKPTCNSG